MSNQAIAIELDAASKKLSDLVNELNELEIEYDKAIEHSANYLGNDVDIERIRDEKAMSVLNRLTRVKADMKRQAQQVQDLAAKY